jgi:hypothetical protein
VILLGGEVRVVDGYVFVCNESVPDERRARQILGAVDLALDRSGHRAVLFDTREMPAPSDEVNNILRSWVDACRYHDKVALLVKSDLKLIASNMRAIAAKVKLRSFHDIAEAEAWLRAPVPMARRISRPVSQASAEAKREAAKPDAARPDAARPDAAKTEVAKPERVRSERFRNRLESEQPKPEGEAEQPRFRWRSPLLREYLGD